jgi:hypothetical protein
VNAIDANAVISDWLARFDLIKIDIQALLLRRQVFHRLQEIVAANPKLHRPSYLYDYLASTYAVSAAAGVRRHARNDDQHRDASLVGLLFSVRRTPEILTRARHVSLRLEAEMPADIAKKEFSLRVLARRILNGDTCSLTSMRSARQRTGLSGTRRSGSRTLTGKRRRRSRHFPT